MKTIKLVKMNPDDDFPETPVDYPQPTTTELPFDIR
jgi:hypothetical protein